MKKGKGKKPAPKAPAEEYEKIEEIKEDAVITYDTTGQAEREAKREAWEKEQINIPQHNKRKQQTVLSMLLLMAMLLQLKQR